MRRLILIGSIMVGAGSVMSLMSYPFVAGEPESCCSDSANPAWFGTVSTSFSVLIGGGVLLLGFALLLQVRRQWQARKRRPWEGP